MWQLWFDCIDLEHSEMHLILFIFETFQAPKIEFDCDWFDLIFLVFNFA